MKFHRPSAVMSNARNNVLIVERDFIYVTEPDGRLVQTIGHRSIKQLYGKLSFVMLNFSLSNLARYCHVP